MSGATSRHVLIDFYLELLNTDSMFILCVNYDVSNGEMIGFCSVLYIVAC